VENHVQLSAAILAGGQARRYGGRDKGALVVDGRSTRERQIAELATIAGDILIVGTSGAPGQGHRIPIRFVADRLPGRGALGGVHTALLVARRLADGRLTTIDLFEDVRVRVGAGGELEAFGDVRRLLANVNSPADHTELKTNQA